MLGKYNGTHVNTSFVHLTPQSKIDVASEEGEVPDDFIGIIQFSDVIFHYPARPDVQVCGHTPCTYALVRELLGMGLHRGVSSFSQS